MAGEVRILTDGFGERDVRSIDGYIENAGGYAALRKAFEGAGTDPEAILAEIEEFLTGTRPVAEPERVLAAVLVASIAGATPLALRLGDRRWLDLMERFRALARREIERFRGRELSASGDGFVASFDGPARAVRCAEAVSQALAPLGADIRAGLHTGEIELAGGAGVAVQIASWIAELAGAGEILVSNTVKDLVAGSGLRFEDRGMYTLKGTPDQWRLYALERAGYRLPQPAGRQTVSELTPREREVAAMVTRGLTNRQIANGLVISEGTAALHVKRILAKLGFTSRAQVAAWAVAQRLAPGAHIQI